MSTLWAVLFKVPQAILNQAQAQQDASAHQAASQVTPARSPVFFPIFSSSSRHWSALWKYFAAYSFMRKQERS